MAEGYSKLRNELVSAANGVGYAYRDTGGGDGAARPRPGCRTEVYGPIPAPRGVRQPGHS
jgi:hypothetical protein